MPVILVQKPRFAEIADLQYRLNKTFAVGEVDWVNSILDDATENMRMILGWQVYPAAQVSYTTKIWAGIFNRLPIQPVVSLDSVVIPNTFMTYDAYDGGFEADTNGIATVTFTAGYSFVPQPLVSWTCVLAAQALDAVAKLGLLSNGGLSSIAVDDFKLVWSQSNENGQGGYTLPDRVVAQLRAAYGTTAFVTGSA